MNADDSVRQVLDETYLRDADLVWTDLDLDFELSQTLSGSIWKTIPKGHKWLHYFPIYDQELMSLRGKSVRILEIGVYLGASLKLWKKFFGAQARIVGIDINPECAQYAEPEHQIHVEIGSQADREFLRGIIDRHGPFDLIMDDGSHVVSHQLTSFNSLFLEGLREGGKYLIEDLEGNYWDHGLRDRDFTTVDLMKVLMDLQNSIYCNAHYGEFLLDSPHRKSAFVVPRVATLIDRIAMYRGLAVVSRKQQLPALGIHL